MEPQKMSYIVIHTYTSIYIRVYIWMYITSVVKSSFHNVDPKECVSSIYD